MLQLTGIYWTYLLTISMTRSKQLTTPLTYTDLQASTEEIDSMKGEKERTEMDKNELKAGLPEYA